MQPRFFLTSLCFLAAPVAHAAPWEDATDATIGKTSEWSNKVELADIDGDGLVDILFANGAGYSDPEGPEPSRAFLNKGAGVPFEEVSMDVFGSPAQTRVLKVRDVDGDGNPDIFMGNSFGDACRLYLGDGQGGYMDASGQLPEAFPSVGDLELGDVDGDGDLDVLLADWGANAGGAGGVTQLWLNDGAGTFTDATTANMPQIPVSWSWELELADVDNDLDLDALISCKTCSGSFLFHNDGAGVFTDATDQLPQFGNNYEFEAIDLTGDGFLDLITINDGPMAREHILVGDGAGGFTDATAELWPNEANAPGDDNMVAFLDYDSDGDADFVIAGLFGNDDRLLLNDGAGHLTLVADAFDPANSSGSLGVAVADLDGDRKLDVVLSEGESPQDADRVFLGVDVAADTAAPKISLVTADGVRVRARIHDNKTPVMPHDFMAPPLARYTTPGGEEVHEMGWYGEALWRVLGEPPADATSVVVCATDAAGNEACSEPVALDDEPGTTGAPDTSGGPDDTTGAPATTSDATTADDSSGGAAPTDSGVTPTGGDGETDDGETDDGASTTPIDDDSGCGCDAPRPAPVSGLLLLGALLTLRRRRR
ncbi:MAG: VCBS repeat-containing protein [Myxococcales bacterium]|nr:VCBS repeat-containing protein [Myxococcales bacterium]